MLQYFQMPERSSSAASSDVDRRLNYVLFSRSGFDQALMARADAEGVWLITPDLMFGSDIVDSRGAVSP